MLGRPKRSVQKFLISPCLKTKTQFSSLNRAEAVDPDPRCTDRNRDYRGIKVVTEKKDPDNWVTRFGVPIIVSGTSYILSAAIARTLARVRVSVFSKSFWMRITPTRLPN